MLDTIEDAAALLDRNGRILYVNRAGAEGLHAATGVPLDAIQGKTGRELGLPQAVVEQFDRDMATLRTGAKATAEYLIPTPTGLRWREDRASPILGQDGTLEAFATVSRDVHDRKQAAETLAQTLAFRDQVIAILGHDLRNPLTAVRSLTALSLSVENVPDVLRNHLAYIDAAARRMSEMIATLIDFAQSRFGGSLPVSRAPADLHDVCRRVVAESIAANPGRRVEIDSRGDGRGEWDEARLAQVVSNLVSNALAYGAENAPVSVSVGGDDSEAVLKVENRGPAIPADLLPALFEPFRRGSDAASSTRGLGLGLYIVRQIVLAHGGTIAVESTAANGTTFTVRLPRSARSGSGG